MAPKFHYPPKEWGIYIPSSGKIRTPLKEGDLEILDLLRERFKDKKGELLTWKWDLSPLRWKGLRGILNRLWVNGYIDKYAKTLHTQSDRPQYISWYIWGEYNGRDDEESKDHAFGAYTGAAGYIVPR